MTEQKLEFECPEPGCDKSFTLERGLKRHLHETHGHPPYKDRRNGSDPALVPVVDERLESLASPLRESIAQDEARLDEIEKERQEIMARIRPVRAAIAALTREHPKPGPKAKAPLHSGKGVSESAIETLVKVIEGYPDELVEFDAKQLQDVLRAHGGTMNLSDQRRVMNVMHQRGMLRLVSANGIGGKKTYAWVRGTDLRITPEPEAVT